MGLFMYRVSEYFCILLFPSEKDTDEWTPWSPCSVTCGHGERKRTKSCGYSCTLTEASKCDLDPCPGENIHVFKEYKKKRIFRYL